MNAPYIGKLESVPVGKGWQDEAGAFTQWLVPIVPDLDPRDNVPVEGDD